jgi:DNA repair ATPase RecN
MCAGRYLILTPVYFSLLTNHPTPTQETPAFQEQMKKLSNSKEFKESIKKTTALLSDPNKAAHAEAKMEHMLKVGKDELKNTAAASMEQAMAAMQDPAVMAEMTKMLKDPNFTQQLQHLMKNDPSFQNYVDAVSCARVCLFTP